MASKERYWTFIVYPESVPDNWERILSDTGLQWCKSPLHDKDIWDKDSPQYIDEKGIIHEVGEKYKKGDNKKPHWHCLVCFNGPTTYKRVCDLIQPINATIPKPVLSCAGMIQYFYHKNEDNKVHYDPKDLVAYNGLDLEGFNDLSETEVDKVFNQLFDFIEDNSIYEFYDFIKLISKNDNYNMLRVARRFTTFFCYYLNSKRNKIKNR